MKSLSLLRKMNPQESLDPGSTNLLELQNLRQWVEREKFQSIIPTDGKLKFNTELILPAYGGFFYTKLWQTKIKK
jgi:hypothetical protein